MWDKDTITTLAHEFKRCQSALKVFRILHHKLLDSASNEDIKLACYNTYVDFVAHLYEFYLACIKNHSKYSRKLRAEYIDEAMCKEVTRILNNRRNRILRGDAPKWENSITVYEVEVPEEFGRSFRKVRNLRSHVNHHRVTFNLGAFYNKYHLFLCLMYEESVWLWDTDAISAPKQDWGEIEGFANAITA